MTARRFTPPAPTQWRRRRRPRPLPVSFPYVFRFHHFSIILPIQRRLVRPLQSSDPKVVAALQRRLATGPEWG